MNIAILASAFHPSVGGVEEFCRQASLQYLRAGHCVTIFTNRWPRSLPSTEIIEGIPVKRLAFRVGGASLKSRLNAAITQSWVRQNLLRQLRAMDAQILHVHCVSSNARYALHAKQATGLPLVVSLHGELTMDATQLFQRERWAQETLCASLEQADHITACSRQTLDEAQTWFGRPFGARARVIYNGIDFAEVAAAHAHTHTRPYLLAIGRHVPQKGFDVLVRAFARARSGLDLILAGDGPAHATLRNLATTLGVADRVIFPGRVDHAQAVSYFKGCAFFVLPSRHEPFGIVNLEAMAAGKAVLAARVGGVPEVVIDGETGILVPPGNEQAFAGAIDDLAADPKRCARLGEAGLARARQFDWAKIAAEHLSLYEELRPLFEKAPA